LAPKYWQKKWAKNVDEIDTWGQFHQTFFAMRKVAGAQWFGKKITLQFQK